MINIIKHGDKIFATECNNCGCEFTYELDDVIGNVVYCPECGEVEIHSARYNKLGKDNTSVIEDASQNERKWI